MDEVRWCGRGASHCGCVDRKLAARSTPCLCRQTVSSIDRQGRTRAVPPWRDRGGEMGGAASRSSPCVAAALWQ